MVKNNSSEWLSLRVAKSGLWVFSLRNVHQLFYIARLVIVARLLAPYDFGLLGIAMFTITLFDTFSQTGFQSALIQKKENTEDYLDSAWTMTIIRGIILFLILILTAPYAANFFNAPEAKLIIQIIGISVLLGEFKNIGVIYFQKELEFKKQFIFQSAGSIASFLAAVTAALIIRNVWALVFGVMAGNIARLIVSYAIHPYRPRIKFDFDKTKDLFEFGKWVLGSSVLVFLVTQGDDVFVGKFLGIATLGFYQMAYMISNAPTTEITHVISKVTFPAYSKLQDDLPKLKEVYLKVIQLTSFLSFFLAGLIFVLAPEFTKIFLGEKWMPSVPAMQILAFAGLVRSIQAATGPVFYGIGKPKIDTKWQIIRLLVLAIFIYPLTLKFGLVGVSSAAFLSIFISNIGFTYSALKITKCSVKSYFKAIMIPLMNASFGILLILGLKTLIKIGVWELVLFAFVWFISYFILTLFSDKFFNYRMQELIKNLIPSLKGFLNECKEGVK